MVLLMVMPDRGSPALAVGKPSSMLDGMILRNWRLGGCDAVVIAAGDEGALAVAAGVGGQLGPAARDASADGVFPREAPCISRFGIAPGSADEYWYSACWINCGRGT